MPTLVLPTWFFLIILGGFGLIFGSFANVVIWRLPRGESLSSPPSHCPKCGTPIRWSDNVPLVGWLCLRGRCRDCGEPISWRYPAVEGLSGALWVLAGVLFGQTAACAVAIAFFWTLMVLAFIDLDTQRLPNSIVAALAAVGAVAVLGTQFVPGLSAAPLIGTAETGVLAQPAVAALIGAALGIGTSTAIAGLYSLVRRRQGMGFGDFKLLGTMGLFMGPYVLLALFFGSLAGSAVGLAAASRASAGERGALKIPFGPFLALGAVATMWVGPALWHWYAGLLGL